MGDVKFDIFKLSEEDLWRVEELNARIFGPGRFSRTAHITRNNSPPLYECSFIALVDGLLVGANIMTEINIDKQNGLLLGPLAVELPFQRLGIGEKLVQASLDTGKAMGYKVFLLIGDESYYSRFGFVVAPRGKFFFPSPVDHRRLLYFQVPEYVGHDFSGLVRVSK